tara:strand:- start:7856 stop:8077 length:222 start_codon:yes stop_codon:yes gene_type:complete
VQIGSLVKYIRAIPGEAHFVYQVAAITEDEEGKWLMLAEEDENFPDKEISPGVMGGYGVWERVEEFEVLNESR